MVSPQFLKFLCKNFAAVINCYIKYIYYVESDGVRSTLKFVTHKKNKIIKVCKIKLIHIKIVFRFFFGSGYFLALS